MAGFVDVSLSGGTLFLRGDALSNGVAVVGTAVPGQFNVVALGNASLPGDPTVATSLRFNGAIVPGGTLPLTGVININADLGAGNDQVGVVGATGGANYLGYLLTEYVPNTFAAAAAPVGVAANLAGSVNIVTGNGNDAVILFVNTPSVIAVDTGAGHDYVVIEQTQTLNLAINTGAGESNLAGTDRVRLRNSAVTIAVGINTYGGSDAIDIINVNTQTLAINSGENGGTPVVGLPVATPERIRVLGVVAQTVGINCDAGSDAVTVGNLAGTSTVNTSIAILGINTFGGQDVVDISSNTGVPVAIGQQLTVTTGLDNDALFVTNVQVGGNVTIDTSSGNDFVALTNLIVTYYLYVNVGDGDDFVGAIGVVAGYSLIWGGPGFDTFANGGGNSPLNVQQFP